MSAAKIQQQAKFFCDYFSKNRKKIIPARRMAIPRERAATSLHFISKQATGVLVILSLSVISCTRLWYVIPHFVLETFKYSFIQLGQEGF